MFPFLERSSFTTVSFWRAEQMHTSIIAYISRVYRVTVEWCQTKEKCWKKAFSLEKISVPSYVLVDFHYKLSTSDHAQASFKTTFVLFNRMFGHPRFFSPCPYIPGVEKCIFVMGLFLIWFDLRVLVQPRQKKNKGEKKNNFLFYEILYASSLCLFIKYLEHMLRKTSSPSLQRKGKREGGQVSWAKLKNTASSVVHHRSNVPVNSQTL